MAEGSGGGVEQADVQTSTKVGRRTFLKTAAFAVGLAVAAGAGPVMMAAERLRKPTGTPSRVCGSTETTPGETLSVSGEWLLPDKAVICSAGRIELVDIHPNLSPVLTPEGQQIGQVLEVSLEANPGDKQASLDLIFRKDPQGKYQVLPGGWSSWSSSYKVGTTDKLVGMRPIEKSLGGKTTPFIEPGPGDERISDQEGRSYGWLSFRNLDPQDGESKEDLVLGEIPSFDGVGGMVYRQEGDKVIVTVTKNLEGVTSQRPVTFKIFLGQGKPQRQEIAGRTKIVNQYADSMAAFSRELSKLVGNVPLMKDRAIWFSWPAYGPGITQAIIQKEIEAGKGTYDTCIIDDGWEEASGSFRIDVRKFPNLAGLAQNMKEAGMKPGIWVCPFRVAGEGKGLPKEWFMKDKNGNPLEIKLPNPLVGFLEKHINKTRALDISVPEVRAYLADRFLDLAKMGFEVFKADYLSVPFTGQLQKKDKTSVEYYRQTFEEIRQRIRNELGKEIEIIGCGAPMMESIRLFNGMRVTMDSALPNPEGMPIIGGVASFLKRVPWLLQEYAKVNTRMYLDAVAVAGRRTLLFRGVHGLILDGIHITDEDIPLDPDRRNRLNQSILALNRLGIGNLFVGDSLVRAGEQGRQAWRSFIDIFKKR